MDAKTFADKLELIRARAAGLLAANADDPAEQAVVDTTFAELCATLDELKSQGLPGYVTQGATVATSEALEHERDLLHTLMDSIPDGIYFKDTQGRFLRINKGQVRNLGIRDESDALGKTDYDFFGIEHAQEAWDDEQRIMATRTPMLDRLEHYIGTDGKPVWVSATKVPIVDKDGVVVGIVGVSRDITERKQAEVALEREQQFLRTLLSNLAEAIVACDANGVLTLFNDTAQAFHNRQEAPITADQWAVHYDLYLADGLTRMRLEDIPLFRALQGETVRDVEMMIVPKDGAPRTVVANGTALYDQGGRKLGAVVAMHDITARKQAEEALRKAKEELEIRVAERTSELQATNAQLEEAIALRDEFLSIAAHELNTPVTAILGHSQMLEKRVSRSPESRPNELRAVRTIAEQAGRLSRLIASLLDISRIQTGHFTLEPRRLDLAALIRRVVDEIWPMLDNNGARHQIEFQALAEPVFIEGDELRLDQALQNLLQNALKYSPQGGIITVRVEQHERDAIVVVADQGMGIPKEAHARLFQRFYRGESLRGSHIAGLGLGLYIVKEIVDRHGGSIEVHSAVGQGSAFTIRLPVADPVS